MRRVTARVAHRRRVVLRVGFVALLVATAFAGTACIFDQGEYKGGGRLGRAATAQQEKPDGAADDDDDREFPTGTGSPPPTTIPPPSDGGVPDS